MSIEKFLKTAAKTRKRLDKPSEQSIEDNFVKYCKTRGCRALKLGITGVRGFPDRTVFIPNGGCFFIEFKKKGKKQQYNQIKIMDDLVKLGFGYFVCDEVGQAETILNDKLNEYFNEMDGKGISTKS